MAAVLLALAASASWGIGDFLGGLNSRRAPVSTVLALSALPALLVIAVLVAIRGEGPPAAVFALYAAAAGLAGIVGIAALYRGLAVGRMGIVAPISATAPLVPVAVGLARGERPTALQGAGMALALVGIVLAGREHDEAAGRTRVAAGVGLGLVAAVCFGLALLGIDATSNRDPYWGILVLQATSSLAAGLWLVARRSRPSAPGSVLLSLCALGTLNSAGTILFALATTKGLVSVVSVLGSLFPVGVTLLARVVLHERLAPVQLAGAAGAVAGVALISAG